MSIAVEVIGYAGRAKSGEESPDWTLGPYIIQAILLLVAPALFAASIYMELGRIIIMVEGEARTIISRKWLTKIFVIGDVLSFLLQGGGKLNPFPQINSYHRDKYYTDRLLTPGGGYQSAGSLEALDIGAKFIIVGLFVQLIFFGLFVIVAITFHRSVNTSPTGRSHVVPWKKHMYVLYAGSLFIMIRSVFRAVEYLQGFDGYLLKHEIYLYVFDAILMLLVMVIFSWCHPAEILAIISQRGNGYGLKMGPVSHGHTRLVSDV